MPSFSEDKTFSFLGTNFSFLQQIPRRLKGNPRLNWGGEHSMGGRGGRGSSEGGIEERMVEWGEIVEGIVLM